MAGDDGAYEEFERAAVSHLLFVLERNWRRCPAEMPDHFVKGFGPVTDIGWPRRRTWW